MPTRSLLTAATIIMTASAAQAAPVDWKATFAPDAVASYLPADGAGVVVPAGAQPKELKQAKAAAAALTAAMTKARGKKAVAKAPTGPLAKLDDADIVARLKKAKATHVVIVRVATSDAGPAVTASIYDMSGAAQGSFTAVAGTALTPKAEQLAKAEAAAPPQPAVVPDREATPTPASSEATAPPPAEPPAPAEPPPAGAPAQDTATPTPAASAPAEAPPPAAQDAAPPPEVTSSSSATDTGSSEMKLRLGVNSGVLYFVPGPSYGAVLAARGGLRLNDWLGAYLDLAVGFGLGFSAPKGTGSGSVSVSAASYRRLAVMGEVSWGWLFAALGPALVQGAWGGVKTGVTTTNGGTAQAWSADGYFPAAVVRAGLQLGSRNRFTLALELSAMMGKVNKADTSSTGTGVKSGDSTLAYSPVLMLGWDLN